SKVGRFTTTRNILAAHPLSGYGVLITRRRSSQINGTLVPTEAGCGHPKALLSDHLWSIGGRQSDR
ncbi:hypothetical protein ACV3DT_005555, partial [Escherichia coli]